MDFWKSAIMELENTSEVDYYSGLICNVKYSLFSCKSFIKFCNNNIFTFFNKNKKYGV